mgnify:CR=1 FL=1
MAKKTKKKPSAKQVAAANKARKTMIEREIAKYKAKHKQTSGGKATGEFLGKTRIASFSLYVISAFFLLLAASCALYVSLYFVYHIEKFTPGDAGHYYNGIASISAFATAGMAINWVIFAAFAAFLYKGVFLYKTDDKNKMRCISRDWTILISVFVLFSIISGLGMFPVCLGVKEGTYSETSWLTNNEYALVALVTGAVTLLGAATSIASLGLTARVYDVTKMVQKAK